MSSVENVMTNDDLDELTAMLQSLDEPVKKAAQVENTDDIDDLLLGLDAGVAMSFLMMLPKNCSMKKKQVISALL